MRKNKEIIAITWAGIGDLLVTTPILRAVKEKCPDRRLIVYCVKPYHREVLRHNPYVDSVRLLQPRHMWRYPAHLYAYLFNRSKTKYYHLFFQPIPPGWIYEKHVREIIPEIFADLDIQVKDPKVQLFFTAEEEKKAPRLLAPYRNTVIMHIHSRSSVNHHWPMKKWEELVASLPDCNFIQIGHNDEPYVKGAIDWRGQINLRDAFCLIKYADSFIGVDSAFAHATNAFDTPGVVLFGDTSPLYWGHDNNINIYKEVICAPCYYYVTPHPCPYGHECMNSITVAEVRAAIQLQLRKKYTETGLQRADEVPVSDAN